jgi:preprotein translocase subunit YajC
MTPPDGGAGPRWPVTGPGSGQRGKSTEGSPVLGNMFLAATSTKSSGANFLPLLIIAAIFVLLYMVMIRPQRNRQRQAMQMQRQVMPGQRIRTTAGMYGTVVSVDDSDVVIEVAPGVNIRMLRRAVMDVLSDDGPVAGESQSPQTTFGEGQSESSFGNGQSQATFGESPADEWNPQDRNPQV